MGLCEESVGWGEVTVLEVNEKDLCSSIDVVSVYIVQLFNIQGCFRVDQLFSLFFYVAPPVLASNLL